MIWFYIAGFVSGAVGMLMYLASKARKQKRYMAERTLDSMRAQAKEREILGGKHND